MRSLKYIENWYRAQMQLDKNVSITLQPQMRAKLEDDFTFWVESDDVAIPGGGSRFTYPRTDMAKWTKHPKMALPAEYYGSPDLSNKDMIGQWVGRIIGQPIFAEDISVIIIGKDSLYVVMSPNSMRFKNDFFIQRLRDN